MNGKLVTKGSINDDGTFRFTIPGGLGHVPLDVLQDTLRTARLAVADVELEIARRRQTPAAPDSDQAIGLDEACAILQVTKSWLGRSQNWAAMGGYKPHKQAVRFSRAALQERVRGNGPRNLKTQKRARLP